MSFFAAEDLMLARLTLAFLALLPATHAIAQTDRQSIFNIGVNRGRLETILETCETMKLRPGMDVMFRIAEQSDRDAFLAGYLAGIQQSTSLFQGDPGDSPGCLVGLMLYGPQGSLVAGVLIDDANAIARKKARQKVEEKAAASRKPEPAPPDAREFDLIVAAGKSADRLAGRHAMVTGPSKSQPGTVVGCVPCFNAVTLIAIIDGVPYTVNGLTSSRFARYRVVLGGKSVPVRDGGKNPAVTSELIDEGRKLPGCAAATDLSLSERLTAALVRGECLNR